MSHKPDPEIEDRMRQFVSNVQYLAADENDPPTLLAKLRVLCHRSVPMPGGRHMELAFEAIVLKAMLRLDRHCSWFSTAKKPAEWLEGMEACWTTAENDPAPDCRVSVWRHKALVATALGYIRDNCHRSGYRLRDLAEQCGVSASHIDRVLKRYTRKSFANHLTAARMSLAESLLRDPQWSVKEIAFRSGYNSVSTFDRAFRRHHFCRPSQWRARLRMAAVVRGRRKH